MYKFSLAAVLDHRKYLEENLQKELGALKNLLADEKRKFSDLKEARRQMAAELRYKQESTVTACENLLYVRFLEQLSKRVEKQHLRVCQTEQRVDRKRDELLEAVKKRKSMEILKEKGFKNYTHKVVMDEQNFMNEMASVRHKRKI